MQRYQRVSTIIVALISILLVACRERESTRVYRIGTDNAYPYHYMDERGEAHGMIGDVINEAARRSGIRLEWHVLKEGPTSALSAEKVDIWPLLSTRRDIWPKFHFTEPYLSNTYVAVTTNLHLLQSKSIPGRQVGSTAYPMVMGLARQNFPGSEIVTFKNRRDGLAALCLGRIEAFVLESRAIQELALDRPKGCEGTRLFTGGLEQKPQDLAIASLPHASHAADRLQEEIHAMFEDGTLARMMHKWSYYYSGETEMLFRQVETEAANRRSYLLALGLTVLSASLLVMVIRFRRAQRAAVSADRAKSNFLANMSHEIRTPMNGILGMTQLALALARDEEEREYLTTAQSSASVLLALLNDILDFSRIEAGKLAVETVAFKPRSLLEDTVKLLAVSAKSKGLTIQSRCGSGVPEKVLGDPLRLRQILINLAGNAVKFTDQGFVRINLDIAAKDQLKFTVQDTGIGIPIDKQRSLFRPFTQADGTISRKYGGSGLGLAISSKLVELMGGELQLQSEPGKGTSFEFTVPYGMTDCHDEPPPSRTDETVPVSPKRILLAEDNLVNQKVASRFLQKNGHTVVVVSNGKQAVEKVLGEPFDLVLMDLQMPEMDGIEATACIRQNEQQSSFHIPIIAMTAEAMTGDRERCLKAGMDDYVSKPVQLIELLRAVSRAGQEAEEKEHRPAPAPPSGECDDAAAVTNVSKLP